MSKLRYACMVRARIADGDHAIEAVQPDHIERIRTWRNAQMSILRQAAPIEPEQQRAYFRERVWNELDLPQPANLLVSFSHKDVLIGYGGLVHIAWQHRRAEVSFLLDDAIAGEPVGYASHFSTFLRLMKSLAFEDLGFHRLCTETYAVRPAHVAVLESEGFQLEGVLRDHVRIDERPVNSLMHGCLATDATGRRA